MEIKPLFPTLVGIVRADAPTMERIRAEVLQKKDLLESLLSYSWGDNVLTSFEKEKDLFTRAGLSALKQFVEDQVLKFAAMTTDGTGLAFDHRHTESWINITKKYGFQERHNHERSLTGMSVSGAFYFNTNNQDGDLGIFPSDMQYKLFENYSIKPEIGKLILFRSEVFHRVAANMTDSDRISFSFNYLLT